jgi:hypothetical protein
VSRRPASRSTEIVPVRVTPEASASRSITEALLDLLGQLPGSHEPAATDPAARAQAIAESAARRAGMVAGTLALPPGPLGWLTVLPELVAIWRIQAQMVADIAGCHGQAWRLTREQMLFCLFRHTAAQAFRDFAVRAGQRWIVQAAAAGAFRGALTVIGVKLSKRALGRGAARWLPVLGAMGVGAYAWYDTRQVARTAQQLFAGAGAAALEDAGGDAGDAPALEDGGEGAGEARASTKAHLRR